MCTAACFLLVTYQLEDHGESLWSPLGFFWATLYSTCDLPEVSLVHLEKRFLCIGVEALAEKEAAKLTPLKNSSDLRRKFLVCVNLGLA